MNPTNAPDAKRRRQDLPSVSNQSLEDGEVAADDEQPREPDSPAVPSNQQPGDHEGSAEEGEVTVDTEREAIQEQVERSLSHKPQSTVSQREVRYYLISSVVCSLCGVKGHMSFACTEQTESRRCHICAAADHNSQYCPLVMNRRRGGMRMDSGIKRQVGAPRDPTLWCYICNQPDHLDCSTGKQPGVISCSNCGERGHTISGCDIMKVNPAVAAVRALDGERRDNQMNKRRRPGGERRDNHNKAKSDAEFVAKLLDRVNRPAQSYQRYRGRNG